MRGEPSGHICNAVNKHYPMPSPNNSMSSSLLEREIQTLAKLFTEAFLGYHSTVNNLKPINKRLDKEKVVGETQWKILDHKNNI